VSSIKLKNKFVRFFFIYLILILFAIFTLFPFYWIFTQSIKNPKDTISYPPKFTFQPTLSNYQKVLSKPDFIESFVDSIKVSVSSILLTLLVGAPFGYCLARFVYKGKEDMAFFVLSTRFMPAVVVVVPLLRVFKFLNLVDTIAGLSIAHILVNLALVVWLSRVFFASVPKEIEEAATIDGCSTLKVLTRITLPLAAPGLLSVAVLSFVFSWNEFIFSLTLTSIKVRTLPLYIATSFVGSYAVDWGSLSAAGMLAILPTVILLLLVQKHLVKGLTFGALQ